MKILLICSKKFYQCNPMIREKLKKSRHEIIIQDEYDESENIKNIQEVILKVDGIFVLNYQLEDPPGTHIYYIGEKNLLKMDYAFKLGKKIFVLNPLVDSDKIIEFEPVVIGYDFEKIK